MIQHLWLAPCRNLYLNVPDASRARLRYKTGHLLLYTINTTNTMYTLVAIFILLTAGACAGSTMYDYSGSSTCKCTNVTGGVCMEWHCTGSAHPDNYCFWGLSTVTLSTGAKVHIADLKQGDLVEVLGLDGTVQHDEFYGWLDVQRDEVVRFVVLTLDVPDAARLVVTPDHLVFRADDPIDTDFDQHTPALAQELAVGDRVWYKHNDGKARPVAIKSAVISYLRGAYAPLTRSGMLLVDGVLASNYANVHLPHYVVHKYGFAPMRALDTVWGTSIQERGIHWYPSALHRLFVRTGLLDTLVR